MIEIAKDLTGVYSQPKRLLQEIHDSSLLLATRSKTLNNFGLFNGKTGVLLALHESFSLLDHNAKSIIQSAMDELQDDISEFAADTGDSFSHGIFGIGWAASILYRKKYLSSNAAEVMQGFDDELYKLVLYRRANNHSLENGTLGRMNYYFSQIAQERQHKSDRYRNVLNTEALLLLVDNLLESNQEILSRLGEKELPVQYLLDNSQYFQQIFGALTTLTSKGIRMPIAETQQMQFLRAFVRLIDIAGNGPGSINLHQLLPIINCLMKLAAQNYIVEQRVNKYPGLLQDLMGESYNIHSTVTLLQQATFRATASQSDSRIILAELLDKTTESWDSPGIAGMGGKLCLMASLYKHQSSCLADCFLI